MLVSHEVPLNYLGVSREFNDYDYALVHLFPECEEYKEFFKDSIKMGRRVLLDNSAYEICTNPELLAKYPTGYFNEDEYAEYIKELKPTWYVLPDVRDSYLNTIDVINDWLIHYKNLPGKTIGVVHGKDFNEMQQCYDFVSEHCDKVAFSFESWWFDYAKEYDIPISSIRYHIINKLVVDKSKPHHLLGCILPDEFKLWKGVTWIESIDTSAPITNALEGKKIEPKMTEKPKTTIHGSFYIEQFDEVSEMMRENAKLFKEYYT